MVEMLETEDMPVVISLRSGQSVHALLTGMVILTE